MMSLRKLVAVAFMFVAASTQVEAQGGGGGGGMRGGPEQAQRMREALFQNITLTADQTKQVDSIMAATMEKRRELMQGAGAGGDRQAMMGQAQALQTEERKAIRELLTKEQQEQFDKNIENMPAMGGGRRPPGAR